MQVDVNHLVSLGLSSSRAEAIAVNITSWSAHLSPQACWQRLISDSHILKLPFPIVHYLYQIIYPNYRSVPQPIVFPTEATCAQSNIAAFMSEVHISDYSKFHEWSVTHYALFWERMITQLQIVFDQPYQAIVDLSTGIESPTWLAGAKFNIAKSCFNKNLAKTAIIEKTEHGNWTKLSYAELDKLSNQIANSIKQHCQIGERIAIIMPMTALSIAIYLGIVKAGCCVVSIPDSFTKDEIAIRLKIADVKMIFTQYETKRDNKTFSLYQKVIDAQAPLTIVMCPSNSASIRATDILWNDFLVKDDKCDVIVGDAKTYLNILFSSGTTGEPKAIPWTHVTPIKCASDAMLHQNLQPEDIFCWPTNLGWMMGPWLIFAVLLNNATIALFDGAPTNQQFGDFVSEAKVTHLGVIPTFIHTWRATQCMEGCDWHALKLFSSTGECSNIDDMMYLMSLAHYAPIIEYCGGTEIGGAYLTSTILQPSAPSAFTTPALGLNFIILNEKGEPASNGEVAIIPPSIGLSQELLNNDHHQVYYQGMPHFKQKIVLRRHGDQIAYYDTGFYRALGRTDDTMKLSGIKISSAEIESVINTLDIITESAVIAHTSSAGGPSQLVIYVVINKDKEPILADLKAILQNKIKLSINPLFKIHDVKIVSKLPRTASNKIMRKELRIDYARNSP